MVYLNFIENSIKYYLNKKNNIEEFSDHDDAVLYQFKDFRGNEIYLKVGEYTFTDLENLPGSFSPYDIESVKLKNNIKLIIYEDDDFQGVSQTVTKDKPFINVIARSLKVINTNKIYNTRSNNRNMSALISKIDDEAKIKANNIYELLKKYREYIDIDNLKFDVHIKNDSIISDLKKKIKQQLKSLKKLDHENTMKIKINKEFQENIRKSEQKNKNYQNYNLCLLVVIVILSFLLYYKYINQAN